MTLSNVGQPKSPEEIQKDWDTNPPRWKGITRTYTPPADVVALQAVSSKRRPWPAVAPRCCGTSCTTWNSSTRWVP